MMRIHLYCPDCMAEVAKEGTEKGIESMPQPILSDVYELLNDGVYTVHCSKGHNGKVVLKNLKFELLFDLGINAIGDGYYREAVASITSALERFYEFFIKSVWHAHGLSFEVIENNWKAMANQSERQLGAYVVAYSGSFGEVAPLMSNSQTNFRNSVIHKGEIPTREKTIEYAAAILELIDNVLGKLRAKYLEAVKETFEHYTPHYEHQDDSENVLTINHPTIIRADEELPDDDQRRNRNIEYLVEMVLNDRHQHRMWFINDNKKILSVSYGEWLSNRLKKQNQDIEGNEFQVTVNPNASAEECMELLGEQLNGYDSIIEALIELHPEIGSSDLTTVYLSNTSMLAQLYYLYLRVRIYQFMLNENPADKTIKEKYEKAENDLREYHKGLSVAE